MGWVGKARRPRYSERSTRSSASFFPATFRDEIDRPLAVTMSRCSAGRTSGEAAGSGSSTVKVERDAPDLTPRARRRAPAIDHTPAR